MSSIRTLSSAIISEDTPTSTHQASYLSLMAHLQSKTKIEKPIKDYKPSRYNEGAYWRKACEKCQTKDCPCRYTYDDEDVEYQRYLKMAVDESLEKYCNHELTNQLCDMVMNSPQKPSRKGQYELSRGYQLTKDVPTPPVIFNRLKTDQIDRPAKKQRVSAD